MTGRRSGLIVPGLTTLAMLAALIGLGTWQVERLHWKLGVLAQIAHAEAGPPVPLPSDPGPWTKVEVTGTFHNDQTALFGAEVRDTRAGPTMGSELIVPLLRDGEPTVLVDRGWVPSARPRPLAQPSGSVTITGYVRPAEHPSWFSARDDVPGRQFFTLNPSVIGRALGLPSVAPFTLIAMGNTPQEGWPDPAHHLPRPPNNHLSYAITWYGLAAALVVIFCLWARKAMRQ